MDTIEEACGETKCGVKQKSEDKPITTSCSTKASSSLKISPIGLGSTMERPHLRALISQKKIETKISLESINPKKIWCNLSLATKVNQESGVLQEWLITKGIGEMSDADDRRGQQQDIFETQDHVLKTPKFGKSVDLTKLADNTKNM
jgi:hypothetical protein